MTQRLQIRGILLAAAIAWPNPTPPPGAPPDGHLTVRIDGLRSNDGQVMVAIFSRDFQFPDGDYADEWVKKPARTSGVTVTFGGLPPGNYAIGAFHDENGNGKLDTSFIGWPSEGYALSNDVRLSFYRPRFAESAFAVGPGEQRVTLHMGY
ncbi:MAG: hypothetical protein JWL84_1742 [Rhodospirillales bacterium]|jgi:uncharacterized protein (DUF2141 family)|nr:hypothetical protein [Rhodospirillales bacterium]